MIRVCPSCSCVDVDELEKIVPEDKLEVSCLGQCGGVEDQTIGYVNGEFVAVDSEEEFFKVVKESL